MPVYGYVCDKCGKKQGLARSIHDPEPAEQICKKCKTPMRRDYTFGMVNFKGTGWGKEAR